MISVPQEPGAKGLIDVWWVVTPSGGGAYWKEVRSVGGGVTGGEPWPPSTNWKHVFLPLALRFLDAKRPVAPLLCTTA